MVALLDRLFEVLDSFFNKYGDSGILYNSGLERSFSCPLARVLSFLVLFFLKN